MPEKIIQGVASLNRWSQKNALKFVGTLFMEINEFGEYAASLGRLSFAVLLVLDVGIWTGSIMPLEFKGNLPPGLLELTLSMAAYNFSKKAVKVAGDFVTGYKEKHSKGPALFKQGDGAS